MTSIAKLIDEAMRAKRMNQGRLSRASGVPQATISRTLKGKTTPETKTLQKLYATLGISDATIPLPPAHLVAEPPSVYGPVPTASTLLAMIDKMDPLERSMLLHGIDLKYKEPPPAPNAPRTGTHRP